MEVNIIGLHVPFYGMVIGHVYDVSRVQFESMVLSMSSSPL